MDKVHTRSVVDLLTSRDKGLNIECDTSVIVKKYQKVSNLFYEPSWATFFHQHAEVVSCKRKHRRKT